MNSDPEPVVEGEAVELPIEPPLAGQPVANPHSAYDTGAAPAGSGSAGPSAGGAWPDPAFDLTDRPEILVGAAFGGGLLLALILRRLGN